MFTKKMIQDMLIVDNPKEEVLQKCLLLTEGEKIEFAPNAACFINVFDETLIKNNTFGKEDNTCRKSE